MQSIEMLMCKCVKSESDFGFGILLRYTRDNNARSNCFFFGPTDWYFG